MWDPGRWRREGKVGVSAACVAWRRRGDAACAKTGEGSSMDLPPHTLGGRCRTLMQARSIECRAQRLLSGWPPPTRFGLPSVVAVGGTGEDGGAVAAEEGRCDGGG